MALIGISLLLMLVMSIFSLILGNTFIGGIQEIAVDNSILVNGTTTTFVIPSTDFVFFIDTTPLINAGIELLITVIAVAVIAGASVLSSGLNAEASKIIILITTFIGFWISLTSIAFNLIVSIEVFGFIIYIVITIAYVIGVGQLLGGFE